MRWRILVGMSAFLVAGCSDGVPFNVKFDEPVKSATLTLRNQSIPMKKNADGVYVADWPGGEADGAIEVTFADGATISCRVGYVTSGMEAQKFAIRHRQCRQMQQQG